MGPQEGHRLGFFFIIGVVVYSYEFETSIVIVSFVVFIPKIVPKRNEKGRKLFCASAAKRRRHRVLNLVHISFNEKGDVPKT